MRSPRVVLLALVPLMMLAWIHEIQAQPWTPGKVFVPRRLFKKKNAKNKLDELVREANPRLYLYPDHDQDAKDKILIVGMPGWGGRSENFIWMLINGLKRPELTKRLVVATIQDTKTGGPNYQGQGDRDHANVWALNTKSVSVIRRFVRRLTKRTGPLKVYFLGFSSGGVTAPILATRIANWTRGEPYTVEGGIALGTGCRVPSSVLKAKKQRALFVLVPKRKADDPLPIMRDDQRNRANGERSFKRLNEQGATVYMRHVKSAKRHIDWHWGLVSNCRYFRAGRYDPGRGYWPNYWEANPETFDYVAAFIQGKEPPQSAEHPPSKCKIVGKPDLPAFEAWAKKLKKK